MMDGPIGFYPFEKYRDLGLCMCEYSKPRENKSVKLETTIFFFEQTAVKSKEVFYS